LKNRSVGADAECQGEHRNRREAPALAQRSEAIADVPPKLLDESHAARVATMFLRLLYTAEGSESGVACLLPVHTASQVLRSFAFQVVAQFVIEFALHLILAK
jgi:hypothetical protein